MDLPAELAAAALALVRRSDDCAGTPKSINLAQIVSGVEYELLEIKITLNSAARNFAMAAADPDIASSPRQRTPSRSQISVRFEIFDSVTTVQPYARISL